VRRDTVGELKLSEGASESHDVKGKAWVGYKCSVRLGPAKQSQTCVEETG
jgi:hypothetical protein